MEQDTFSITFNPELKLECAQLVLDQGRSHKETCEAMGLEKLR